MKTVILAAGYATRLYPITEHFPKPLLEIGGSTILDRMLADLECVPEIDEHLVVSNHKFIDIFEKWAVEARRRYAKPIRLIDDGSVSNETRIGAVCDLLLAIGEPVTTQAGIALPTQPRVDDDLLVMAADNVLDFSLTGFVDFFRRRHTSCILCYDEPRLEALRKSGVAQLDPDGRLLAMEEKNPNPASNWAVPPFYLYHRRDMELIRGSVKNGCAFDAPGNLVHYLAPLTEMHAYVMPGRRYDIGDVASYQAVKALFE